MIRLRHREASSQEATFEARFRSGEWLGVAWFTALFVLAIGVTNGDTPQNSYLLFGLRLADPGFIVGDWYTWETVHSHPFFAMIVAVLSRLGPLTFGLTLGMVLQNAGLALALYAVLKRLYERPILPWAATLAMFAALDATSLGSEPWVKSFLGVSSLAGVSIVVAIALLMRGRTLAGGIWLGVSALIHVHFLILSLPILLASSLALQRESGGRHSAWRMARMWGGYFVVSIPPVVQLVRFGTASGAAEIHWLTESLFPYHIAPWTWSRDPLFMLVGAIFLGVGGLCLRAPRWNLTLVLTTSFVTAAVFVPLIIAYQQLLDLAAQAWPWRLSPLVLLAGLTAGMGVLAGTAAPPSSALRRDAGLGFLISGAVIMAALSSPPVSHVLLLIMMLPIARSITALVGERWSAPRFLPALAVAALISIAFVPLVARSAKISHIEFKAARPERTVLYEWVLTSTPEDAVFAIPPTWEKFRTIARRPIIVDWKAISRYPPDRIEWVERMRTLTGVERPSADGEALDEGYSRMDCDIVGRIRSEYGVRFVVHERPKELPCGEVVYEDEHFRIWDLEASLPK